MPPIGPVGTNNNYAPAAAQKQFNHQEVGKLMIALSLGLIGLAGCTPFVPNRPENQDSGAADAPTDGLPGDVMSYDVIQSDIIQLDVLQSDSLQNDAQADALQSDALQADAQLDGPHCGVFSETDNWTGVQTDLDPSTISGSLILAPFKTSGSYLKLWDLGSANNNLGSGATITVNSTVPNGTSLTVETCTNADGLACSSWVALNGDQVNSPAERYLHVKFTFSSTSTSLTPQLNDYSVGYCVL